MTERVQGTWTHLMRQASATADEYLLGAMTSIRSAREGGVKQIDLELAVELSKVAALDYLASAVSVAADKIADALELTQEPSI